jgi:hypothetical protein
MVSIVATLCLEYQFAQRLFSLRPDCPENLTSLATPYRYSLITPLKRVRRVKQSHNT